MKKLMFLASMLVAGMMLFVGCEPSEKIEKPEEPVIPEEPGDKEPEVPVLDLNTYRLDGTDTRIGSAFAMTYSGYITFYVTKQEGIESFEQFSEMTDEPEYLFFLVTPSLLNKELDLMTEKGEFSIATTFSDVQIGEGIAPDFNESINEGKAKFEFDEATRKCRISIKFSIADGTENGKMFELLAEAVLPEEKLNENIYSVNGNEKPLRASFYLFPDETSLYLYFTSAEVVSMDELTELAETYVIAVLPYTFDESGTISVNASEAAYMYVDNYSGEMSEELESVTTAEVSVGSPNPDTDMAEMSVKADLDLKFKDGVTVKICFDGNSISGDYIPPVANEFTYNNETVSIGSAVLDRTTEPYTIWFHKTAGCEVVDEMEGGVTIKLPADCFDGEPVGFSQTPDFTISYGGNIWSGASGDSGTVTASLTDGIFSVEATNYDNFSLNYNGPVVVIEK